MAITLTPAHAAPLGAVDIQQRRLLRLVLISLIAGIAATAPIFLIFMAWPAGVIIVAAQLVVVVFSAVALYQLRAGNFQRAIMLATSGFLLSLACLFPALGLRASTPFLPVAFIPLTMATMLGSRLLTRATVGISILIAGVAALESLEIPWIGIIPMPELPEVVIVSTFAALVLIIGWFLLQSGQTLRTALAQGQQRQRELEELRDSLETTVAERTASLQTALDEVAHREARLAQTLADLRSSQETIQELSAPVIPVLPGVLVVPLIGAIDSMRAAVMTEHVLSNIENRQTQAIIFDVTGVPIIDTQVAQVMLRTATAAQLLGTRVLLVGIRPEVAQTMVALNISLGAIRTFPDLRNAVESLLPGVGWQRNGVEVSAPSRPSPQ